MPHYKKAFDIGTYTGNGGQYRVGIPTLRGVGPSGKQAAGSLRFRNAPYLSRTQGTPTSNQKWTLSVWFKKSGTASNYNPIYSGSSASAAGGDQLAIYDAGGGYIRLFLNGGSSADVRTTLLIKDTSIWYNLVVAVDTTQATASNRIRMYLNGSEITSFSIATYPSQNYNMPQINASGNVNYISRDTNTGEYFNGYFSEYYVIDGQQLTPSSFGELNSDGIWVPKAYSGTYGTNGFYLPMNSSSNYATDQSGNGNNWTPSGFNVTTANTSYDLMTDSPTDYLSGSMSTANNAGNYATFNPIDKHPSITLSNASLTAAADATTSWRSGGVTFPNVTSGKWYYEATASGLGASSYVSVGWQSSSANQSGQLNGVGAGANNSFGVLISSTLRQTKANATTVTNASESNVNGDVLMVAVDFDNSKAWIGKNGTWYDSGNPSTGANPIATSLSGGLSPAYQAYNGGIVNINFGQRAFTYTPPTGFTALNTYNYPRPTDSSLWFYGDTPDLMWIKNRSTTGLHTITDTVRGMGLNLVTSSTAAETSYPGVTEMNKFGMSIINDSTSILNGSTNSHVYWGWKAGGATVTNTSGSITSQVSANPSAGFSVVSFNSGTSADRTVGHGLGAAPNFIIMKSRTSASYNWAIYHSSVASTVKKYLVFTTDALYDNGSNIWGSAFPTSSVFGFTSGNGIVASTDCIAYCWTAIPGYSAFGSYTGSGSADGPFVYLGFRPRWLLRKRTDTVAYWVLYDTVRNTYNLVGEDLYPNDTLAGSNDFTMDILSNGFKIRGTGANINASGGTYIYAAFAEVPFKFARAR